MSELSHLSVTTGVGATGNDGTITVLLHELAVTHVVLVDALEALAVLILLDGGTIALAILEDALELRTVGIAYDALPVGLSVLE